MKWQPGQTTFLWDFNANHMGCIAILKIIHLLTLGEGNAGNVNFNTLKLQDVWLPNNSCTAVVGFAIFSEENRKNLQGHYYVSDS